MSNVERRSKQSRVELFLQPDTTNIKLVARCRELGLARCRRHRWRVMMQASRRPGGGGAAPRRRGDRNVPGSAPDRAHPMPDPAMREALQLAIRAGDPIIAIENPDEARALELVRHVAEDMPRPLYEWSIT